jgi:pyridoxine/pyridoxamine 5'-phosphate oxidase
VQACPVTLRPADLVAFLSLLQMASAGPFEQFDAWLKLASSCGLKEPNAMSLGTADAAGSVSVRYVLLKGYSREGFVFYTNYDSSKVRLSGEGHVSIWSWCVFALCGRLATPQRVCRIKSLAGG